MSAEVIARLARRWHCSPDDVGRTIVQRLANAGLVDAPAPDAKVLLDRDDIDVETDLQPPAIFYTLGVTDDDRIFVLDANDQPLLEL